MTVAMAAGMVQARALTHVPHWGAAKRADIYHALHDACKT